MLARGFAILLMLVTSAANAERVTEFYPFIHDTSRPEVLVLEGDIGARTPFVFKRALQRFQRIEILELVSGGGSVYDALPLAYDVRAAGLTTFIPPNKGCASACSYLFFAGVERRAEGRLGVHQIGMTGGDPEAVQHVLGDVFALFEDFDVPSGVHSKMMATPADDMFWFEPSQMASLGLLGRSTVASVTATPAIARPPSGPSQTVITVSAAGGGSYLRIADAINAAPEGARVEIYPGKYQESIFVTKSIDLVGVGPRDEIVLEAVNGDVITWNAAHGTIVGLTIRQVVKPSPRKDAAVKIFKGTPVIRDCDVSSKGGYGFYVVGAESIPTIANNVIHDSSYFGIYLSDAAGGTIEDNDIYGNGSWGIAIISKADPLVQRNQIHGGNSGIRFEDGGLGAILDNEIFSNLGSGIAITHEARPVIRNNRITNNRVGIVIQDGGGGEISGNDLRGNREAATKVDEAGEFVEQNNDTSGLAPVSHGSVAPMGLR